jgi:hypothetical protein
MGADCAARRRIPHSKPPIGPRIPHPGTTKIEGSTAVGRAYILEFGRMRDGRSELNDAVYHDRYQRTPDGWRFAERIYEVRYLDPTPLAGSPPATGRPVASRRQ